MVALTPRPSLIKKVKAIPTFNPPSALSAFARATYEDLQENPALTPEDMEANQTLALKLPLEMMRRIHWLLHPDQNPRLTPDVLQEFHKAAWNEPAKDLSTLGLEAEEVAMIRDILERKPNQRLYDQRQLPQPDADHIAMLFLLMRQGASSSAAKAAFRHPHPDASITSVRREVSGAFPHYQHRNAWNWGDAHKYPL